jgi:hypothetical protein
VLIRVSQQCVEVWIACNVNGSSDRGAEVENGKERERERESERERERERERGGGVKSRSIHLQPGRAPPLSGA